MVRSCRIHGAQDLWSRGTQLIFGETGRNVLWFQGFVLTLAAKSMVHEIDDSFRRFTVRYEWVRSLYCLWLQSHGTYSCGLQSTVARLNIHVLVCSSSYQASPPVSRIPGDGCSPQSRTGARTRISGDRGLIDRSRFCQGTSITLVATTNWAFLLQFDNHVSAPSNKRVVVLHFECNYFRRRLVYEKALDMWLERTREYAELLRHLYVLTTITSINSCNVQCPPANSLEDNIPKFWNLAIRDVHCESKTLTTGVVTRPPAHPRSTCKTVKKWQVAGIKNLDPRFRERQPTGNLVNCGKHALVSLRAQHPIAPVYAWESGSEKSIQGTRLSKSTFTMVYSFSYKYVIYISQTARWHDPANPG